MGCARGIAVPVQLEFEHGLPALQYPWLCVRSRRPAGDSTAAAACAGWDAPPTESVDGIIDWYFCARAVRAAGGWATECARRGDARSGQGESAAARETRRTKAGRGTEAGWGQGRVHRPVLLTAMFK